MGEVDPIFIQDPEHRPKLSVTETEGIPLIDLSPLNSSDNISDPKAIEGVAREIGNACKEWGFFQVINHGVLLDKKKKITRDEKSLFGYYDTEHTKNVRDWKEVFDFAVEEPMLMPASLDPEDKEETKWTNQWPEYPPELR
ncbi:codeine O-demethylase-like [Prunus avium]|uniref:Codeine O-demethylase-like n=1 Tax=Prunus avium TaxID=42229 RepID=A0A6P5TC30_PRUAV|nr:codeine O-demethylase-like [Prunus avium]